jgi:hypothetical protein
MKILSFITAFASLHVSIAQNQGITIFQNNNFAVHWDWMKVYPRGVAYMIKDVNGFCGLARAMV